MPARPRATDAPACADKTAEILRMLGLEPAAEPQAVAGRTKDFCTALGMTMSLQAHGVAAGDLPGWAAEAHGIRRLMDNNPRDMTVEAVEAIYRAAF